ncbi:MULTISPECIES: 6-phosphogluconolactonase [Bradyrhizobium]|uniref:6-phosphogluconolactonase n=1 Tax=Bradyrhizobium ottawaense TaxID=931866 RepID=A0ABV4FKA5_9BRAD|nr:MULTISPECIES: 6-phosphogluconolactonase [Bradyrhizobium]MBR1289196.1 6-phosphogluconolactonase [Bradyrhizobium ottawaense]MDA9480696.1 6-phosphogluconolactonase [Bradyrhizobium sp. CCBAU 11445]WLB44583.1 6-phosphogluconolactonase [Bradyrhizobium ottawaense]WQN81882.1 6-phosphogluconolactonase [Bradyrhizobium ottawaense]BBO03507.1 6-phosphogluconolactonase [Bradyrhizobium ottawaense]
MAAAGPPELIVAADAGALAQAAAERVMARITANPSRIAICLTGGSSPKKLYQLLGSEPWRGKIPWDRVHWFIGDERFVPDSDPLNNMAVARATFLDRNAPSGHIHPIPTTADNPDRSAEAYARELQAFYGSERLDPARPLFDLVLMGAGPDGHTASLFPGFPEIEETERWVVGVPKANVAPFVPRVSLTLPALASCREMLFEIAGHDKQPILTRIVNGETLPALRARSNGETVWLVDRAALPEDIRGGR